VCFNRHGLVIHGAPPPPALDDDALDLVDMPCASIDVRYSGDDHENTADSRQAAVSWLLS
jgi:hypothetical protein